jgi:histidinol-phosphate aminotransferase
MKFNLEALLRPNIRKLTPYSSARHEFSGEASVFLDANENSMGSPIGGNYHRYPDPNQGKLKAKISAFRKLPAEKIFIGNGSDEAIDLLYRMFCIPGKDRAIVCQPTYGMYGVSAAIHDIELVNVPLQDDFQLDVQGIRSAFSGHEKLLFICSPNNPTGNSFSRNNIIELLNTFPGIVVIDEAYIDFSSQPSWINELDKFPNMVVMQTFSKAWGLAGLRVGMAFASEEIIAVMNKVKAPYNLSEAAQQLALSALEQSAQVRRNIEVIVAERHRLAKKLEELPGVIEVYPSDANFLLVKTVDAKAIYQQLIKQGIVVRDRSNVQLCEGCLRITIGTPEENEKVLGGMVFSGH